MTTTYLAISRIGIENIREEFARTSNACNYQTMYVEAVNNKVGSRRRRSLCFDTPFARCSSLSFFISVVNKIRVGCVTIVAAAVLHFDIIRLAGSSLCLLPRCFCLHDLSINSLCHSIKVDQKTEKHLIGGGTVLVDPAQITQNRDCWDVFAMKRKYRAAKGAHGSALIVVRSSGLLMSCISMQGIVLKVVGGGDLR